MGRRSNTKPQRTSLQTFLASAAEMGIAEPPVVTWHAARATFCALERDVVLMCVRGPVTTAALDLLLRELVEGYSDSAAAWIVDLSGALVLASTPEMVEVIRGAPSLHNRRRPCVFVETAEQEESLMPVSLELARKGCPSRRFLTWGHAYGWALEVLTRPGLAAQ